MLVINFNDENSCDENEQRVNPANEMDQRGYDCYNNKGNAIEGK